MSDYHHHEILTMEELIQRAQHDDNLRESLQRMRLSQLQKMQAVKAQLIEQSNLLHEAVEKMPSDICLPATTECLTGAGHLVSLSAATLTPLIEQYREDLDKLGTPQ